MNNPANTQKKLIAAGIDIGHSMVKIASGSHKIMFPSVAIPAFPISDQKTAEMAKRETVRVGGKDWFFGDTALNQSQTWATGLNDDWINSPEHCALILGAVKKLADLGVPAPDIVVAGLPIQAIKADPESKNRLAKQFEKLLPNTAISIVPQPYGAFCDITLSDNGTPDPKNLAHMISWAVIDIGFYTTDFIIIKEGLWIEMASSSCPGISLAAEHLVQSLALRNIKINMADADKALKTKFIPNFGKRIDITEEANEALSIAASKIIDTAERLFAPFVSRLNGVLVTGGGTPIVKNGLEEKWEHAVFPDDHRMTVVLGMRKLGEFMALQRSSQKA